MQKAKEEREELEIKECTFKPDMTYTDEFLKSVNQQDNNKQVVERAYQWKENADRK